ncbi:MAG: hypothetical protein IID36_13915 [Planctomycetes bacterium]|nr:hypothetical protein [Planctomycetota bacterium]
MPFFFEAMMPAEKHASSQRSTETDARLLFSIADSILPWLREDVRWPADFDLRDARLARIWIGRRGRITFELVLGLTRRGEPFRTTIQGGVGETDRIGTPRVEPRVSPVGVTGLRHANRDLNIWVCSPDRDRKLRAIRPLLSANGLRETFAATTTLARLGLDDRTEQPVSRVVAYRVHKRCVLHVAGCESAPQGVFVKVFRRPPPNERLALQSALADDLAARSAGTLLTPRVLDVSEKHGLISTEGVAGQPCRPGARRGDLEAAADVLATLHTTALRSTEFHTPRDEINTTKRWSPLVAVFDEQRGERFARLIRRIDERLDEVDSTATVLLHRDYYGSQLLRDGETTWLTDLDTLATGHAEVDVGTMTAHVLLDMLASGHSTEAAFRETAAFTARYRAKADLDPSRLAFYLSSALIRLGGLHLVRGCPGDVVDALWRSADACLDGSPAL